MLEQAATFYQQQLDRYPEALHYLKQRGLHDLASIKDLRIGYAPGASLRRHLTAQGYSFDLLRRLGLLNPQGCDAFHRRVVFPCCQAGRIVNLYGRSIDAAFAHRFLPGSKGGLYAWEQVRQCPEVILVEGLFDYAVLWQAGFRNVTCSMGTCLNTRQIRQLLDGASRTVYLAFDSDDNGAGQQAACRVAQRLGAHGVEAFPVELPQGHDPNSFFAHGGGDAYQFQELLAEGAHHELRVDLSGRPRQRTQPVSRGRSAHRARGGLDQPLSGSMLRPRLGLAHLARLCLRPDRTSCAGGPIATPPTK